MENVLTSEPIFTAPRAGALVWTGRVLTGLLVAFFLFDSIAKLVPLAVCVEGTQKVGFAADLVRPLGMILLVPTLLHVIPRTQFLGALLLTAYLGGATATHVRMGAPFWFPIVTGAILWIAYCLRSPELRSFVRSSAR